MDVWVYDSKAGRGGCRVSDTARCSGGGDEGDFWLYLGTSGGAGMINMRGIFLILLSCILAASISNLLRGNTPHAFYWLGAAFLLAYLEKIKLGR